MEDGGGIDFTQFRLWYEQAGTPRVNAVIEHDAQSGRATLGLEQAVPPKTGHDTKKTPVMPLRVAPFDTAGTARPTEQLILVSVQTPTFLCDGCSAPRILLINPGISAPAPHQPHS